MLAAQAAAVSPHGGQVLGGEYELMMAQLVEHRRALKDIQSIERKIEAKRQFLPVYKAWVEGAVEHGNGAQDIVLMTVLVWLIDVGEFSVALHVARYALQHNLQMPDQYDRDLATVLLDEIGGAVLAGKVEQNEAIRVLQVVDELTAGHDAPDQARAKLHKAIAYAYMGRLSHAEVDVGALQLDAAREALKHCRRAVDLFDQVGVKKDIERLVRRLNAAGETNA